jgi:hypothetical protein
MPAIVILSIQSGRFGLTMFVVMVMNRHYFHADIVDGEITTVMSVLPLGYPVKTLEVRFTIVRRYSRHEPRLGVSLRYSME